MPHRHKHQAHQGAHAKLPALVLPTPSAPQPTSPLAEAQPLAWPDEVYLVGCGSATDSHLQPSGQTMGFKAWNLLRMAQMGLPVPPAFVVGSSDQAPGVPLLACP